MGGFLHRENLNEDQRALGKRSLVNAHSLRGLSDPFQHAGLSMRPYGPDSLRTCRSLREAPPGPL
jgi:hypothetical protein